ncbi:acetyl-CoA carboxylase biotin carboxyl carrier protein [Geodermatophilus sp. SYSU D00815]
MKATELPPRAAMNGSGAVPPSPEDTARALRDEVVELARALPGDLRRLTVRSGDRAIEIEWAPAADGGAPAAPRPAAEAPPAEPAAADGLAAEGLVAVRAPLVGTFYAAPSPDADPFVREGDEVEAGQTLAIVEAMKLMNPIVAEEGGVVTELLVRNAESVEYDQVLMLLRRPR